MTRTLAVAAAAVATALLVAPPAAQDDALWQHRNLGKAFYENPTTRLQAVDEFRKALDLAPDSARERVNYGLALLRAGRTREGMTELQRAQRQDPSIPNTWFVLGVEFRKAADYARATAQFERMVRLVPDEPISRYNLGYLYRLAGRNAQARAEFEQAVRLDPRFAAPHFQLFNLYRDAAREDEAAREQQIFLRLKREQEGRASPEDVDWSRYAEIVDPPDAARPRDEAPAAAPAFEDRTVATGLDPATADLLVLDADADGHPDVLVWSRDRIILLRRGSEPAEPSGLEDVRGIRAIAAGDFDNDGRPDLCVVTDDGAALYANRGGVFARASTFVPGRFNAALWVDYDHDYDLDVLLLGRASVLMRNDGSAGFSDETRDFPFAPGEAVAAAVVDTVPDQPGHDIAVAYADHPGLVYRDRLAGHYEARPAGAIAAGVRALVAIDVDGDGAVDLLAMGAQAAVLLNRDAVFTAEPLAVPAARTIAAADLENRGARDVIVGGLAGRNAGGGKIATPPRTLLDGASASAAVDLDLDGRVDLVAVAGDGAVHLLRNATKTAHHWIRVTLAGVKNLALAPDSQIEVKAGALYQKQRYAGVPVTFGIGSRTAIDAVRITWPNGLIQNETRPRLDAPLAVREAPRLSGSCPMIFTWDGRGFEFVTDVLGVAPLGASAGDGSVFPVDHDEYVQIPSGALRASDGAYDVRMTEELREVSYIDQVQLVAVDHPSTVDVFTNEKFKSPPFPEFRLYGVTSRSYPLRAEQGGADVRQALAARDGVYAEHFRRDYAGVAELHALDLDFGGAAAGGQAVLILNGWVDWADGSTFRGAAQEHPGGLVLPYLQVKDAAGRWTTVVEDMGLPAGKPKTIAVDLSGRFLSASREIRIVTSLCVYWDEIFLSDGASPPPTAITRVDASGADLRFRGFSTPRIDPERRQPERFDYSRVTPASMWNPTSGYYTRYGDVRPLVTSADDRFVIMGSGDELRLRFPADALPPFAAGWARDFLLLVDGWAKDADANTAYSQSVEPLPFHAMSAYPYPPGERYPDDAVHRAYREAYNTRPALRLIRPLAR